MKIAFLKTFLVAAETLNISKTAVIRGVSQPAISKQIKELEKAVGCDLFNRINNRIHISEEGKYFLRKAEQIVRIYEQSVSELRESQRSGNSATVGASSTLGSIALPEIVKEVKTCSPDVRLSVSVQPVTDLLYALKDSAVDFCLLEGDAQEYSKEFTVKPLCSSELVFITSKESSTLKKEIQPEDLTDATILLKEEGEGFDQVFCSYAKINNISFDKKSNFSSLTAIKKFVKQGLGVGCVPKCVLSEEDKKEFAVHTIKDHTIKYDFFLCLAHDHKLEGTTGEIIDISNKVIKNIAKNKNLAISC